MKFNILINQKSIVDNFPAITLKDAAILNYFADFAGSDKMKFKVGKDGKLYYWINYKSVSEQLPLLKYGRDSVYRSIKRLCDCELLSPHPENSKSSKSYFRYGDKYHIIKTDQEKAMGMHPPENNPGLPPENNPTPPPENNPNRLYYKGRDYK